MIVGVNQMPRGSSLLPKGVETHECMSMLENPMYTILHAPKKWVVYIYHFNVEINYRCNVCIQTLSSSLISSTSKSVLKHSCSIDFF